MFSLLSTGDHRLYIFAVLATAVGILVGFTTGRSHRKLTYALTLAVVPLASWGIAYSLASQNGCAGGNCTGAMIFLMVFLLPLIASSLLGIGVAVAASIEVLLLKRRTV